jgi:rsbT co-antagonist protein RsbR
MLANWFFVAPPEGKALRVALGDALAPSKAAPSDASAPGRAAPSDASAPGRTPPGAAPAPRGAAEQGAVAAWPNIEAALYRAIRDSIPAAIWAIDRQGVFIHHEGKGLEAAGVKPGQFLGKNIFEMYAGSDGIEAIKVAFTGEVGHTVDEQHAAFWETWYIPVRDAQGTVTMVAGVTLDVSAAKRAERELRVKFDLIESQRQMINALSTPIIEVWDKVLTVPMLGVVDSERASKVMTSLLERVAATGARVAILDLTGIETMDTATAVHMLKLIQSIRLLGAEGIITGIRPSVAQTMVALGLDLGSIVTRASLRDGLQFFMTQMREEGAPRS